MISLSTLPLPCAYHNPGSSSSKPLTRRCSLGYIPGHIHAFWLIYKKNKAEERYGRGGYQCTSSKLTLPKPVLTAIPRRRQWPVRVPSFRTHPCPKLRSNRCLAPCSYTQIYQIVNGNGLTFFQVCSPPVTLLVHHRFECMYFLWNRQRFMLLFVQYWVDHHMNESCHFSVHLPVMATTKAKIRRT